MSWTYIRSEPGLWTVGQYGPAGKWEPESDHGSTDEAAARVRYLNGGYDEAEPEKPKSSIYDIDLESLALGELCVLGEAVGGELRRRGFDHGSRNSTPSKALSLIVMNLRANARAAENLMRELRRKEKEELSRPSQKSLLTEEQTP